MCVRECLRTHPRVRVCACARVRAWAPVADSDSGSQSQAQTINWAPGDCCGPAEIKATFASTGLGALSNGGASTVRPPKLTVAFSQSSCILMAYRVAGAGRGLGRPERAAVLDD